MLVAKSIAAWLVILALAMANGVFRESVLRPNLSMPVAYLVSGLLLSLLILFAALAFIRCLNPKTARRCILIGALWLLLTLIFEFGFGVLQGKSWAEMTEAYLFREGNIWPVVLLVTFFSPLIAFRLRLHGDVHGH